MRINPAPFHLAQAIIVGICAALAVAILGTAGHSLHVFNTQQSSNPWWLPLWPQHFDVAGTKALIGSAAAVFALSVVFLVFALVPSLNLVNKPTLRALIGLGTALPGALVTLVTVIYAHILNHDTPQNDTIQTWTCKYKDSHPLQQDLSVPSSMGNGGFASICTQSKFALWGSLTVFILLAGSLGLTVVTWFADKWAARKTRKELEASGQI